MTLVLASYRRVFSHPGARAFSLTGLVARLPISMMTLGIVLLVSARTGSYALAAFSLGSLIAGVVAGAVVSQRGPLRRARAGMALLAVGTVSLPFLLGLPMMTLALFVTGLALAPTLIALFSLIEASVPGSRLNEAMGVVQTGVGAGIAPGTWLAGVVADGSGGSAAYWVCAVSAVLAAVAGLAVRTGRRAPVRAS